jgi:2-polyprenyl-3-methyl-5-hydroxy-6-metoxy-1,4-benzoquinol methylase
MKFTGERLTPECRFTNRELFLWHLARYEFAKKYIQRHDRVLDVACGTGYGTYELGIQCREIVGLDISGEAIEYARDNYSAKNIFWQESDCTSMGDVLVDSSFDVVVSFETIEHLDREAQFVFIDQIVKVLRKDGIAIISTPNVDVYGSWSHMYGKGSYHQFEMNKKEFLDVLETRFNQVFILGQAFSETSKNRWRAMKMAAILNGLFKLNFRPIGRDYEDYEDVSDFEFSIYNFDRSLMFLAICKFPRKE